jgi:hypothetical protein
MNFTLGSFLERRCILRRGTHPFHLDRHPTDDTGVRSAQWGLYHVGNRGGDNSTMTLRVVQFMSDDFRVLI